MKTIKENLDIILSTLENEKGILSTDYKYSKEVDEALSELSNEESIEKYYCWRMYARPFVFECYIKYNKLRIMFKKTFKGTKCIFDISIMEKPPNDLMFYDVVLGTTLVKVWEKEVMEITKDPIEQYVLLMKKMNDYLENPT